MPAEMAENRFTLLEPDHAHRRRAAILAVVGVQNQQQVQGVDEIRVHLVPFAGHGEHHVQEVLAVGQVVFGIDERLADRLLVAERGDGRHFGQHAVDRQLALLADRADRANPCSRSASAPTTELRIAIGWASGGKPAKIVFIPSCSSVCDADVLAELLQLLRGGQFAVDQQVGHFLEIAALGHLFHRIAAVAEDALLAVEKGDRTARGAGVGVAFVQGDAARWCEAIC